MGTIGHWTRRTSHQRTVYRLADRLHSGRAVRVSSDEIAGTVSAWLAELGVQSPMVDELVRAIRAGDWPAAHRLGDYLSVDVSAA